MPKLSLVIPCFNEAENLELLLTRLDSAFRDADIEVILVDNGSNDNTQDLMSLLLPKYPFIKGCTVKVNCGYGYGILCGLSVATGSTLGWTHADLQTDPADVLTAYNLLLPFNGESVIVKGSRHRRGFIKHLLTLGMQCLASAILGVKLSDINAQPKVFSRGLYDEYFRNNAPKDFSLDLFLLYLGSLRGVKLLTIPVYFNERLKGEAKGGGANLVTRLKLIYATFLYIFKLKKLQ